MATLYWLERSGGLGRADTKPSISKSAKQPEANADCRANSQTPSSNVLQCHRHSMLLGGRSETHHQCHNSQGDQDRRGEHDQNRILRGRRLLCRRHSWATLHQNASQVNRGAVSKPMIHTGSIGVWPHFHFKTSPWPYQVMIRAAADLHQPTKQRRQPERPSTSTGQFDNG
jgi:hypothetical protein